MEEKYLLVIVAIVAIVGIVVLIQVPKNTITTPAQVSTEQTDIAGAVIGVGCSLMCDYKMYRWNCKTGKCEGSCPGDGVGPVYTGCTGGSS